MKKKVLIFIVCYNAEKFIATVLNRIPEEVWSNPDFDTEVLIIDDQSTDQTYYKAHEYAERYHKSNLIVLCNPQNQGYGGNQKIGYHYAIANRFDVVVLLHGDGQYAPEEAARMIEPILKGDADAVFASRMIHKQDALKGNMPLYKWVGNQVLTFIQNRILGTRLAEFHTGYRAYSVPVLASIPFDANSDDFDFDTDIIIQLVDTQRRIQEIPIPTFYGEEISRVNGIKYGTQIVRSSLLSRVMKSGIFYHPKFDYETGNNYYTPKFGFPSSHQFALDRVAAGSTVLDVGCGPGFMARELSHKNVKTISVDRCIQPETEQYSERTIEADVDTYDFAADLTRVDTILALDIIEHLRSPERLLRNLRSRFSREAPQLIITTANIAFFPMRIGLLLGRFSYGKKGILDLDHTRLFTFGSLRSTLINNGYDVFEQRGIPAPFPLAVGNGPLARCLLAVNTLLITLSKGLFSYQIAIVAKPRPTLKHLLQDAQEASVAFHSEAETRPNPIPGPSP